MYYTHYTPITKITVVYIIFAIIFTLRNFKAQPHKNM